MANPALRDRLRETAEEPGAGPKPARRCRCYAGLVWQKAARALRDGKAAATAALAEAGCRATAGLRLQV
jgi:hypothetical protein